MSLELLQYFNQVLGIKQIMFNSSQELNETQNKLNDDSMNSISKEQELSDNPKDIVSLFIIGVENLDFYSPLEKELLNKMIQAIQIENTVVFDLKNKNQFESQISLQNNVYIELINTPVETYQSYSPSVLLNKNNLKKDVWEFLKINISKYKKN